MKSFNEILLSEDNSTITDDARLQLRSIAKHQKALGLTTGDALCAMAEGHGQWSTDGMLLKTMGFASKTVGSFVTLLVFVFGVGALVWVVKNNVGKVLDKIRPIAKGAMALLSAPIDAGKGILRWLNIIDDGEVRDANADLDALSFGLTSVLTGPVGLIAGSVVSGFDDLLGTSTPSLGSSIAIGFISPAAGAVNAIGNAINQAPAQQPPPQASNQGTLPPIASNQGGGSIWGSVINGAIDLISTFIDGEVRDEQGNLPPVIMSEIQALARRGYSSQQIAEQVKAKFANYDRNQFTSSW